MRERRRGAAGRRRRVAAVVVLGLGLLLLTAGVASAASPGGEVAMITFHDDSNVVTLAIPPLCPMAHPQCVWQLFVNEPDVPGQTIVSAVTGASGVLTVAYPANFCGVIQADALVGPAPWRLIFGHQRAIQTGNCSCPTATATGTTPSPQPAAVTGATPVTSATRPARPMRQSRSARPAWAGHRSHRARLTAATSTTTTTTAPSTILDTACQPITGAADAVPATSDLPFTGSVSTVSTAPTTLPFTGVDVKPLLIGGTALILLGLGIGTTGQQRRRAVAVAVYSVRTSRGMAYSRRAARWFFGD